MKKVNYLTFILISLFTFVGIANAGNVCTWTYQVTYNDKTYDISISASATDSGTLSVTYSNDCAKWFGTSCESETKTGSSASALEDQEVYISAADFAMITKDGKCPATAYIDLEAFRNYDKGGKSEVCIGKTSSCAARNNTATYFTQPPESYTNDASNTMTLTTPKLTTGTKGNSSSNEDEPLTTSDFGDSVSCDGFLGDPTDPNAPAYYLSLAFKIMKYAAIILVIVLSIVDFFKAVVSQDKDLLKKATISAAKRLVFAIIIFFLPLLLDYLLSWLSDAYSTCIS